MAVRLNVVMVHPPRGNSAAQNLSEAVVGELIGLPGFDLTLIEPLDQIQTTSTDHLTLDSLTGDIALLAWQPVSDSAQLLSSLGIDGLRVRHASDPDAPAAAAGRRRIYGFDLTKLASPQRVHGALQQLLQSRQVRTHSLERLPTQPPAATAARSSRPPSGANPNASPSSPPKDATGPPLQSQPPKPPLDLDDLVDQLDLLDP